MTNTDIKFAAAYSRVSTEEQTEFSLDAQIKAIKDYAAKNGYTILPEHIYVDDGYSGRKAEKRPAFMRMIATAKQKPTGFEAILVHKLDRFARSREDSVVYKSLLRKECGVKVISITESIEDDKFSVILEAMLEAMAEYYSINLSEEVKKGMTEKAIRGGLQSTPSFGYFVEDNILVVLDDEAAIIKEIFSRFISGAGYFPIAKWLNELGITTHRGSKFEHRTVEYIIRNPVYIGKLRWNPTGKTRRNYDNENIILGDGKHKPIIDLQTWEAAQRRVAEVKAQWRYHGRPASEYKDWISGIVRCASCGSTLVFSKPHYWKCNGYVHGKCRDAQHVRDDLLKDALIRQLNSDYKNISDIKRKIVNPTASGVDEIAALENRKASLSRSIERLRAAYLSGTESVEEYAESKKQLENELQALNDKITALQKSERPANVNALMKMSLRDVLAVLNSDATNAEKHNAVARIIDNCVYDKSQNLLTINYRFIL